MYEEETINLGLGYRNISFTSVPTEFGTQLHTDVFAKKNNRTVFETLSNHVYAKFSEPMHKYYPQYLDWPLGDFLFERKQNNDPFYKGFLNPYGDLEYCQFSITHIDILPEKGIYIFAINKEIVYIGRCLDNFKTRINNGYGRIHPKNCYLDGQRVNCKVNNLVTKQRYHLEIYIKALKSDKEIITLEKALIAKYKPLWNVQYRTSLDERIYPK